ncbi:MAG: hypothetical protein FD189_1024 [Elusimicrobia bacterium]|nr:MAG: hypothetical protein FD154_1265 [Elusimicrobiota bacterium]KAF0156471.1 MAG: hypothetical protein FD189_1024 [Elusimicrobiota bacterium]
MAKKSRKRAKAAQEKGAAARGAYLTGTPLDGTGTPCGRVSPADAGGEISGAGWLIVAVSVITAVVGYFLLSKAAPEGRDLYSNLSPFVILAGYIGVAVGIMWPGRRGEGEEYPASAGEKFPA